MSTQIVELLNGCKATVKSFIEQDTENFRAVSVITVPNQFELEIVANSQSDTLTPGKALARARVTLTRTDGKSDSGTSTANWMLTLAEQFQQHATIAVNEIAHEFECLAYHLQDDLSLAVQETMQQALNEHHADDPVQ